MYAQLNMSANFKISTDTQRVRIYKPSFKSQTGIHTLQAKVKFNDEKIIDRAMFDSLCDGLTQVISVDYVFTQYDDKKTQDELNKKRLFELYLAAPFIFQQSMVRWRFVEQMGFMHEDDAPKLFHGFVIRYQRIKPFAAAKVEDVKKELLQRMKKPNDSLFEKVFSRSLHFGNDVVVADYTCSMSGYYNDMMAWFCLHQFQKQIPFAFFNDGDGIDNDKKIIGKTGGVHQFATNSLDSIAKYVFETIKTGCSGDEPENDIEAILKAIEKNPMAESVILIADNWSDMRDYALRYLIKKPVHIILCGTEHGINIQYLNLARETKGSVHTMKEDLDNLYKLGEGTNFKINGQEFVIRMGKIEKVVTF